MKNEKGGLATAPSLKHHNGKREAALLEKNKKMGRPTENPRPNKLSIRISDTDKRLLEEYCARTGVNRTEAISRGIGKLKSEDAATPDEVEAYEKPDGKSKEESYFLTMKCGRRSHRKTEKNKSNRTLYQSNGYSFIQTYEVKGC